jgi:hypothetical protein
MQARFDGLSRPHTRPSHPFTGPTAAHKPTFSMQARFDGLSRPHALILLRQHKWSYGEAANALEAKPGLLADLFGPAFARPQADAGGKTGGRVAPNTETDGRVAPNVESDGRVAHNIETDTEADEVDDTEAGRNGEWDEVTTESDAFLRSHLRDRVLEGAVPLCREQADGSTPTKSGAARYVPVPDQIIERLLSEDLRARYESNIVNTFLTEASCWQVKETILHTSLLPYTLLPAPPLPPHP